MRVQGAKKNKNLTAVTEPTVTANTGQTKERILNVFIVDASGSMQGSKYINAINGVNELLKSISQDTDTDNNVLIVEFEGHNIKRRLELNEPIPTIYKGMGTDGMTPLNQAIGETLEYVYNERKKNFDVNNKVLVSIFTDGGENSSSGKYKNPEALSQYIKELENDGFTITFIGTKQEVNYAIQTLSMDSSNTEVHDNSARGIAASFEKTLRARVQYSKSVSRGEDVKADFYTKTLTKEENK
jgi:Mg-chelatase subunit ChlD